MGFWTIQMHIRLSGAAEPMIQGGCPIPETYQTWAQNRYTSFKSLDFILCFLVEFFRLGFLPENRGWHLHWISSFSALVVAVCIEGTRDDRWWWFSPTIMSLVYQLMGSGMILPFMFIFIALLPSKNKMRKPLTQTQAESVFVATVFGFFCPTLAMIQINSPHSIAIWQVFPLWMGIIQTLYLTIRPKITTSGLNLATNLFWITCVYSILTHIYVIYKSGSTPSHMLSDLINWWPSVSVPDPTTATPSSAIYHSLKWDLVLSYVALVLLGCYLMEDHIAATIYLVLSPVISLVLSPGVCMAILWIQRERALTVQAERAKAKGE